MTTVNPRTRPLRAEERLIREHMYLVGYAVVAARPLASRATSTVTTSSRPAWLRSPPPPAAFDPDRGVRFDRYANTRIKGALLDELRRADWATRSVPLRARQVASRHREADAGPRPRADAGRNRWCPGLGPA